MNRSVYKAGFISPPAWFDISPTEFKRIAPENTIVLQTIMRLPDFYQNSRQFTDAVPELRACYDSLAAAGANVIAQFGYPFSLVHGWQVAQRLQEDIESNSGSRFIMMGVEVVNAIKHLGGKSIAVAATYYSGKTSKMLGEYLDEAGLEVLRTETWQSQGMAQRTDSSLFAGEGELDPMDWATPVSALEGIIRKVALTAPEADAILVSGGGMRVLDLAERLEKEINKPVIGGDISIYWGILRRLGIKDDIRGHGVLLASLSRSSPL
jgi:maleate cis-trans isomerase